MCHRVILSLRGRKRNRLLFYGRPRNKTVQEIEAVTRNALPISLIRSPISIGYSTIADKTAERRRNDTPIKIKLQIQIKSARNVSKNAFTSNKMSSSGISIKLTQGHSRIRDIRPSRDG